RPTAAAACAWRGSRLGSRGADARAHGAARGGGARAPASITPRRSAARPHRAAARCRPREPPVGSPLLSICPSRRTLRAWDLVAPLGQPRPRHTATGANAKGAPLSATNSDLESVQQLNQARERIVGELRKAIVGQDAVIEQLLTALFAGGHVLLVGVPGLA